MKRLWGKKALDLNETTCALTFARLFEYSDYTVAVETPQLWLSSRCNKLDIICVHTLWFGSSYLGRASDIVRGNLAGRSDMAAAGTDVAVVSASPASAVSPLLPAVGPWGVEIICTRHVIQHLRGKAFPSAFKNKNQQSTLSSLKCFECRVTAD